MRRSRRVAFTVATAPTQLSAAALVGFALSRAGRNDASGWGDLVGAVIGVMIGAGIGLGVILVLVARALRRPWTRAAALVVLSVPSGLLLGIAAGPLGIGFPAIAPLYLGLCTGLVWWYSGRPMAPGAG
jgi:hypothetical protein